MSEQQGDSTIRSHGLEPHTSGEIDGGARRPRLLLVELVSDKFYRAVTFPFIHGFALRAGVTSEWVRFAALDKLRLESDGVPLRAEDVDQLRGLVERARPSHVVFSVRPASSLLLALDEGTSDRQYAFLLHSSRLPPAIQVRPGLRLVPIDGSEHGAARFLGMEVVSTVTPDFGWVAGNEAAASLDANPFVILGSVCSYNKSVAINPFFRGLDLSTVTLKVGCTFCSRPNYFQDISEGTLPALERQLAAIERTCPRPQGRRLQIWMLGGTMTHEIDAIAALIARMELRPADFRFESRVDQLLGESGRIERALGSLEGTGHRVAFAPLGVENFASPELERFNKGVEARENIAAAKYVSILQSRFPDVFLLDETRDWMTMITLTPWTRPEELDLNIAVSTALGLRQIVLGNWLRLTVGTPLEAKARQDGLVSEEYGDPLVEYGRKNFYAQEVPWRFAAPEMEVVTRILLHFQTEPESRETFAHELSALRGSFEAANVPLHWLAHLVVLAVQRAAWEGGEIEVENVLSTLRSLASRSLAPANDNGLRWIRPSSMGEREAKAAETLLDDRPVVKMGPIHPDDLEEWRAVRILPNKEFRRKRVPHHTGDPVYEMFFGRDPRDVQQAIALTSQRRRPGALSPEGAAQAAVELGRRLGYPECCVQTYTGEPGAGAGPRFIRHVANRIATPAAVPPEMNPACGGVDHLPCSLGCAESRARAERRLGAPRRRPVPDPRNPVLLLDGPEEGWVELMPKTGPSERFRYAAGCSQGAGAHVDAVISGDELVLGKETVLIFKEQRPYASLSGRAFLWWHERALQMSFWGSLADRRPE